MRLSGRIDLGLFYSRTDITIPIRNEDRQEAIGWFKSIDLKADDEIIIEVKKKRKKRSLNAMTMYATGCRSYPVGISRAICRS